MKQDAISSHVAAKRMTGQTPAIRARQRIEQTIALAVVKALLDAGYSLGVNDGEETTIHHSRDAKAIEAALFTTDEDWLLVYEKDEQPLVWDGSSREPKSPSGTASDWWVRFVYGNDGRDVVCDYCAALDDVLGEGTAVQALIDSFADGAM